MNKQKLIVLTGAGMSAESGIRTFRETGGLWEEYDIKDVASPGAWIRNPDLVRSFYNQRRRQLFEVEPNSAHRVLADLESSYDVQIITQNVDDLHERAGSSHVLHLHGELRKVRSSKYPELIYSWEKDLSPDDRCEKGAPLRPHIVWFGEAVPMIEPAIDLIRTADILLVIGTSLQVYPATSLIEFAPPGIPAFYIDPGEYHYHGRHLRHIRKKATDGMEILFRELTREDRA